jgi:dihydroorotate dehydrogenase (fumarate)
MEDLGASNPPVSLLLPPHFAGVALALAASTGVETADDVAAYLLADADVVITTSSLLRHGPGQAAVPLEGLAAWMERKGVRRRRGVPRHARLGR